MKPHDEFKKLSPLSLLFFRVLGNGSEIIWEIIITNNLNESDFDVIIFIETGTKSFSLKAKNF